MNERYTPPPWATDGAMLVRVEIFSESAGDSKLRWRKPWMREPKRRETPFHISLVPAGAEFYDMHMPFGAELVLPDGRLLRGYTLHQHTIEDPAA